MQRDISELDFSNDVDILYAYKNIKKNSRLLKEIAQVKISSFEFGIVCLDTIESAILEELGESFVDNEMIELIQQYIISDKSLKDKNTRDDDQPSTDSDQNAVKTCNSDNLKEKNHNNDNKCHKNDSMAEPDIANKSFVSVLDESKQNEDSNVNNDKTDGKKALDDPLFHCKLLNILLRPLVNVCNKQIVDLVYYVYRKTGISHFDFLFNAFTLDTQKIELHLLVAKGIKARSFDFTDFKEYLKADSDQQCEARSNEFSLSEGSDPIIPLPFLEPDTAKNTSVSFTSNEDESSDDSLTSITALLSRPFKEKVLVDQSVHLSKAKDLLLSAKYSDANFLVDNLSNFLYIKFDREIFEKFLSYSNHYSFCIHLNKLQNVPFFFYEQVDIRKVLSIIPKMPHDSYNYRKRDVSPYMLKVNSSLLKSYLDFSHHTFNSLESLDIDYILVAKGLKYFVGTYRSCSLFKIFFELLSCKITNVSNEIKSILLPDLSLYLDVFYGKAKESNQHESSTDKSTEIEQAFPNLNDPVDILVSSYLNPGFYAEIDRHISQSLLDAFEKKSDIDQNDVDDFIEALLFEISLDSAYKICILESIEKICEKINNGSTANISESFDRILQNLKIFPKLNWRYKKAFILKADVLEKFGIKREWIKEEFKNDRVFYIKNMTKSL
ncbi:uncharacterized protein VICG_01686 [Vittaforma corneae ATCC 50505]|uniref:Uncharacterized protein n=1 Tax=Vittaforma corneae (strain ATCC 50505) TaxID=993615 RepID=L2GKA5_VITCO|nr:uncharacterized protein VICG_01686 [Vittaforma corneae ATCC 50505]ELA41313.1 hypothetical protein VICG_01686 [Vittaforma corneae ATCC 50505]